MNDIRIRDFRFPEDYAAALSLWQSMGAGVRVGPSDAPGEIQKKLQRDPDLFLVAEAGNQMVGTAIGGFDGRRGLVYHVAVAPAFRRKGLASRLMDELEQRLRRKGCIRCYLLVRPENVEALSFYADIGWSELDDHILAKDLV